MLLQELSSKLRNHKEPWILGSQSYDGAPLCICLQYDMAALIAPWIHEPLAAPPGYAGGAAPLWCSHSPGVPRIQLAGLYHAGSGASHTPRRSLVSSSSGVLIPHAEDQVRSVSVPPIPRTSWDVRANDITRRAPSVQQKPRPVALPLSAVRISNPISPSTITASFHSVPDVPYHVLPEGPAITPLDVSPSSRRPLPSHARLDAATSAYRIDKADVKQRPLSDTLWQNAEPIARSVVEFEGKESPRISAIDVIRPSRTAEQLDPASQLGSAGSGSLQDSSPKNSVWKRYFAGEDRREHVIGPLSSSRISTADSQAGADESAGLGECKAADTNWAGSRAAPVRRPSTGMRRYQPEPQCPAATNGLPTTAPNSAREDLPDAGQGANVASRDLDAHGGVTCQRPVALRQLVSKFGPPVEWQDSTFANRDEAFSAAPQLDLGDNGRMTSAILPAQGDVVLNSSQVEAIAVAAATVEHAARSVSLKKLHELRSFRQPPVAVCQVVDAVATLLGCYEPTWSSVKRRLDSGLLHRLMSFSAMEAARCPSSRVQDFLELLAAPAFCDGSLAEKCPAVAPLAEWCMAVAHLLLQLRATDTHMQAEQDSSPVAGAISKQHREETSTAPDIGGLYVDPPLWELDDEALCCVEELVVGRDGVGHITFHGPTDCRKLLDILPHVLMVERGEIVVYPDAAVKPEVGHGLNKPATVVLYGCMPKSQTCLTDSRARTRYKQRVAQMTEEKGAIFEDYDPDNGTWKFRVLHF